MKSLLRLGLVALGLLLAPSSAWAANRFAICSVTCNWNTIGSWSTASGGGTGASVPGSSDAVIFDAATCTGGVTCTMTIDATVNVQTFTMGACTASTTGCIIDFSVNNNNMTAQSFSGTGSGTRTLKCGSGNTWTLTATQGNIWNFLVTTNLTETCTGAAFVFQPSSTPTGLMNIFPKAGESWASLSIVGNTTAAFPIAVGTTTSMTVGSMSITGPVAVAFQAGTTFTISTTAPSWSGTSSSLLLIYPTAAGAGTTTIALPGATTLTSVALQGIRFSSASNVILNGSYDLGQNSITGGGTLTINNPSGRCIGC